MALPSRLDFDALNAKCDTLDTQVYDLQNAVEEHNARHTANNNKMMDIILQLREDIRQQSSTGQGYTSLPYKSMTSKENQVNPMEITVAEQLPQCNQSKK